MRCRLIREGILVCEGGLWQRRGWGNGWHRRGRKRCGIPRHLVAIFARLRRWPSGDNLVQIEGAGHNLLNLTAELLILPQQLLVLLTGRLQLLLRLTKLTGQIKALAVRT